MINCCYHSNSFPDRYCCFSCNKTKCFHCVMHCFFCKRYICVQLTQVVGYSNGVFTKGWVPFDGKRVCYFCKNSKSNNCNTCDKILDHSIEDELMRETCISCIQNNAAKIIQKNCYNWLWKPICNDGKPGINVIIGMKCIGIV